ncbi:hypothetical protein BDV25DRAFT_135129 [Aspergillus avenaceus]|uniref:N-acetyltransferase domain-containing protein n=1 Tax=Aspergillus avenaceus TaxID=36643 RepID=A0A5N6U8Y1_ASPAV|nr:hypothetical protein BDV25DRAFT_135129 [Aspergillus avenaceus]
MKKTVLSQIPGLRSSLISESISGDNDNKNAGMVALLYPPSRRKRWSFLDFLEAMRLWALDLLDPATDEESQQQRVIQMTNAHSAAMRSIESRYGIDNLWYLEVVAVDPSRQGCGIGRLAMARILDQAGNNPMVLECTAERNLRFYVSLGFVVVEEMGLVDEPDIVKLWVMLRQAKHKGKMD